MPILDMFTLELQRILKNKNTNYIIMHTATLS